MNRIYRLVWNASLSLWVAVAENAKGASKGGSSRSSVQWDVLHAEGSGGGGASFTLNTACRAALVLLTSLALFTHQARAADAANASISAGTAGIATVGNTTTINQSSQRVAIDWTSLSTAANEALIFNQPNASAIALNRITGSSPSEFLGSLTANGQVFILNPNGVLFGAGSQVNVGGLVASTLAMSNADFMAGNHVFTGSGGSGSVVNKGSLKAAPGGYLALLAPEVRNEGVMTANLGTALLAAGNKITLNIDNGSLLGYSIDQGAINALAENKLLIQANGGQVLLSAKAMDNLTTATVNNTGVIEAKTVQNKAGRILLMGDMEVGTVNVGGTLDASAPDGGNGGFIETSAANVNVAAGTQVTTKATDGQSGTWLIDPVDFTIAAGNAAQTTSGMGAATLSAALGLGNVSIATDGSTAGNGDINVNSAVSWASPSTLTLTAHRDINFTANVTYSGGGAGGLTAQATRNIAGGGTLNVSNGAIDLTAGGSIGSTDGLGQIYASSLKMKATTGELVMNSGVTWNAGSFDLFAGTNIRGSDPNSALIAVMTTPGGSFTASSGNTGSGRMRLNASNNAIGTLNLTALGTGGGGEIDFTSDSAVSNAFITAAKDVNVSANGGLFNIGSLNLMGANQNVSLGAGSGVLTLNGPVNTGAGNLTLSGSALSLSGALNANNLSLTATGGLSINTDLTATGNLTLASNIGIQQTSGALTVGGTTSVNAGGGEVSLTGAGNNFTGAVSVTNLGANNVTLNATGNPLTLGTLSLGSGTLNITGNNITQTGAITQAANGGAVTVNGGASAIDLSNTGNNFTGAVSLNNTGSNAVTIRDADDLKLGASTVGGSLTAISNSGSISQSDTLNVTGASTFTLNGLNKDVLLGTSSNTFGGGVTVNGTGSVRNMSFRYATGFAFPTVPSYTGTLTLVRNVGAIDLVGLQTFSGHLSLTAGGGINMLGGTLQTGGAQSFSGAVNVVGATNLISTGSSISFGSNVNGPGALSITSSGNAVFAGAVGGTTALSSLSINSGGTIVSQTALNAGDLRLRSVNGLNNGTGGAININAARVSAINTGSGNVAMSYTGTGKVVVTDLGMGDGIQNSAAGGNVSLTAANGAIQVLGSKVSANNGNVVLSAAGNSDAHSLEIVNNGATGSTVSTTGAGTITLSGNLTSGGASATGGSAAGVAITGSSITGGTGAVSITGSAGGAGRGGQIERGFRVDAGSTITGAGSVTLTGTVTGNQPILPDPYTGPASMGGELANGATVSSTGGDVSLTGSFNNSAHFDGTGLAVNGKLESGAGGKITISGTSTTGTFLSGGLMTGSGTGLSTGVSSEIVAGTGGLDITGTVNSTGLPTNLTGARLSGTASSTGNIAVTGSSTSAGATGVRALDMLAGSTLTGLGAATITLRGSGVPGGVGASSYDVGVLGTVSTAGGQINLAGDRMRIENTINSGSGRTVITPTTANRQISLGESDEVNLLNLSNSELNFITASALVIGGSTYTGGIRIGNSSGAINMTSTQSLSLLNNSLSSNGISQTAGFTVANLNADARTVMLSNTANQISQVSGRAYALNFQVRSGSASGLTVGTVDGTAGITNAGTGAVVLTATGGALTQTQAIIADSFQGVGSSGITLTHAGNQIQNFFGLNTTFGGITLRNTAANVSFLGNINSSGRVDIANTGSITLGTETLSTSSNATGTTAGTAAMSIVATGGISAPSPATSPGTHLMTSAGGTIYLEAGNGSIGDSAANAVSISAAGPIVAVANGAGSQVNLSLVGNSTLENISAAGAVNVSVNGAGNLAVKTVAGSSVTLGAAAGAITDANGAANNITSTTLNATAANGITLGTNVTGLQTLTTTGATGDISIAAANAINTSNFGITTNAGAAQTVNLSSGVGITIDSAFGNAQDKLKLTTTAGNIAINGALTASELTLNTAGATTQTAAITATGLELLGTGNHTLNNAGNAVTTLAGNTGNVDYSQAGALTIGTVNTVGLTASNKVLVRATGAAGDITLNNTVTSGSAASDSLVLAAGRNFINNAGATPLNPGAGRFLVYSTDPTTNTFGGFASTGNAFSRTYAANAPTDASMTSITGNRMVYSVTPVINITGDNQTKVYGAADPTLTYTVGSGLVAGDTAGSVLSGLLAAPTGAAASAGTHAITQGALAAALGYGVSYTSGTLTVDKATVSVTGVAANNKTYDGNATATLGTIGTLTGLAYGELLTLSSTGASFSDASAANGKTVTATYNVTDGTGLASNYQLAAAPVTTTANIDKANLNITANNDSRTAGGAAYTGGNGVNFSGFVNGETMAVLGGALAYSGSSQGATAAGNYAIKAGGYSAGNYALNYVDGVLTINPVPVAPTAPAGQGGGAAPVSDAYLSALYNVANSGGSGGGSGNGGGSGGGADPGDALRAAAAEAGNTGEDE
ncbi:filamentous hemagglutinin family N-terminal domain-containing protein [Polaromonas sp. YR568]|uniref:two-partner secretion domain-containing protein n=1 Tax=Polaromonas sp. YR568 TaxID=1855301 RepID=UPI0008E74BC7|nr:MBG domain-containing protein [Polaromonas sp. YR568]SFU51965.1 filamentous hemagglutinin family N-terminal domain-containing protein [Polaromonas sp. YR568]